VHVVDLVAVIIIDTSRIVCVAKSRNVLASVRLSVPSFERSSSMRRVCYWAPCGRRYRSTAAAAGRPAAAQDRSKALSSKCVQCRVDGWRRKLNTDLLLLRIKLWLAPPSCSLLLLSWFLCSARTESLPSIYRPARWRGWIHNAMYRPTLRHRQWRYVT